MSIALIQILIGAHIFIIIDALKYGSIWKYIFGAMLW